MRSTLLAVATIGLVSTSLLAPAAGLVPADAADRPAGRLADAPSGPPAWTLDHRDRTRDAADRLAAVDGDGPTSTLRQAQIGTRHQMELLGAGDAEPVPTTGYDRPSAAAQALADRHSVDADGQLAALDGLPADQAEALAGVLDAYIAFERATDAALADVEPAARADGSAARPAARLEARGLELGRVLASRNRLLAEVSDLQAAVGDGAAPPGADVDLCPALAVDAGGGDTYTEDCSLIVDLGGDDVYENNAGGAHEGTATVVDLAGADVYGDADDPRSGGVNGGGATGSGVLIDAGGSDTYIARSIGVNGGASAGTGLLVDAAGHDTYQAGVDRDGCPDGPDDCRIGSFGVNGGAYTGVGLLLDAGGDDVYDAGVNVTCTDCYVGAEAVNGGGDLGGVGTLVDMSGADRYRAGVDVEATCTPSPDAACRFGGEGVHGGAAYGAVGVLVDGSGDDTYHAGTDVHMAGGCGLACGVADQGAIGGAFQAAGQLFDGAGADVYEAGVRVTQACSEDCGQHFDIGGSGAVGGVYRGTGLVDDGAGNDTYRAGVDVRCVTCHAGSHAVHGGGYFGGSGRIVDADGSDVYEAGVDVRCGECHVGSRGAVGGGARAGAGQVVDDAGDDTYHAGIGVECGICVVGSRGVTGGASSNGAGTLIDAAGDDVYRVGVDVACSSNCALVGTEGVNGGGPSFGGSGLLADGGGHDRYRDADGGTGVDRTVVPKGVAGAQIDSDDMPGPALSLSGGGLL